MLLTWHNLQYYQDIMRGLRAAIESRTLEPWIATFETEQALGDIPACPTRP
jgi:queuine tRNA-ribosyltransferase